MSTMRKVCSHCFASGVGFPGQARYRVGGNVPLIGIAPWGVVKNKEQLVVDEGSVNYGYITRKPVQYKDNGQLEYGQAVLEPHHTNFILVRSCFEQIHDIWAQMWCETFSSCR